MTEPNDAGTFNDMRKMRKRLEFHGAVKSFLGYLEGTSKARHTISSYANDLGTFEKFLQTHRTPLRTVTSKHLDDYHDFLRAQGMMANTRRRKLLTVRRFFKYLVGRKQLDVNVSARLPAPYKVERVPKTLNIDDLINALKADSSSALEMGSQAARNRALVWTLAETGALVSEVARLRFDSLNLAAGQPSLTIFSAGRVTADGGASRDVPISDGLLQALSSLDRKTAWLFLGFNKGGPLAAPITPRGIEILLHSYGKRLSYPALTPRLIRHSRVLSWLREGKTKEEVQRLLGLRSDYAFRVYAPLLQAQAKPKIQKTATQINKESH